MYKKTNAVNIKYKALHGFYWMLYCLPTGYITVFLLAQEVPASIIGTITALSSILAAAGQLIVGNITDSCKRLSWKGILLIIGAVEAVILLLLILFQNSSPVCTVLFPAFLVLMYLQMPLINASIFYYTSRGLHLDFGSARGMGSLTYAFISFVAGQTIVRTGQISIIYLSLIVLAGLIVITILMPSMDNVPPQSSAACNELSETPGEGRRHVSIIAFSRRYPRFMLVLLGSILIMAFHSISHTYMIQIMESVGGDSAAMGTAFSIEAIAELPVMFGFYKLIQRFSPDKLMVASGIAFVLKSLAYLFASGVITLYLAQILQMFSYAVFASASVYFANEKMSPEDKVTGQSYMTATVSIGAVVGNFVGGIILTAAGVQGILLGSLLLTAGGAAVIAAGIKPFRKSVIH